MWTYSQHSSPSPETFQNTQPCEVVFLVLFMLQKWIPMWQGSGWAPVSLSAKAMASATWGIRVVFPDWALRRVRKDPSPSTQADTAAGPSPCIPEMQKCAGETPEISNNKWQCSQLCKVTAPLCSCLQVGAPLAMSVCGRYIPGLPGQPYKEVTAILAYTGVLFSSFSSRLREAVFSKQKVRDEPGSTNFI